MYDSRTLPQIALPSGTVVRCNAKIAGLDSRFKNPTIGSSCGYSGQRLGTRNAEIYLSECPVDHERRERGFRMNIDHSEMEFT